MSVIPNADNETEIEVQSRSAVETLVSRPNAAKYLSELQLVAVNYLPEDSRTCIICQEIYNTGVEPEQAYLVGRCGHVLGGTCLSKWVMPEGRRPNDTCPFCRTVLFEDDIPDQADALVIVPREPPVATIKLLSREEAISQLLDVQARLDANIQQTRNDQARLDENEERLLDLWKEQLDLCKETLDSWRYWT